jgi:hypothetical protein
MAFPHVDIYGDSTLMAYAEIFAEFPQELRLPIARLIDTLRDELAVGRADFEELRAVVRELAQAQARTEGQLGELTQAQARTEVRLEELAQAQARTEVRLEELAQAQTRTEVHLEELAQAQARTEARLEELAQAQARTEVRLEELVQAQARTDSNMEALRVAVHGLAEAQQQTELRVQELAQAQQRTELRVDELGESVQRLAEEHRLFRYSFESKLGGLGARWGMQTEEALRQGMREILREVGFTAERFLAYDVAGEVFGHPDQVELDIVVQNGKVIVVEIKSSLDQANMYLFDRKVAFYARQSGRQIDRKLIVTPFVDNRSREIGLRLGVEICTDITALS